MKATYIGKSGATYWKKRQHRIIELSYDEETEREVVEMVVQILREKGWSVDTGVEGWGAVEVDEQADFKVFMEDWKLAKKAVREKGYKVR